MDKNYPFFPALVAVLGASVLYFGFDLFVTLRQRSAQQKQLANMSKILPEAQAINQSMTGLSRDLISLAPNSPGVKKIVEDFKIQALRQPDAAKKPAK